MPTDTDATSLRRVGGRSLASVLVGGLGALVAFKLRTVPVPTDPWHYVQAGLSFPEQSWNLVGLTRYGMVLPMIPVTRLFGESELSYFLMPILMTGVLLACVHWLTRRCFGQVAAIAAVILVLGNSVVLVNASRMYPDIFATAMTALAFVFAVAARDRWQARGEMAAVVVVLLMMTGAAVGLSWWMRETAVFAWPVVAAVLVWKGGPPVRAVGLAAGGTAFALLLLEMGISQWAFGDPWARFDALVGADLSETTNPADLPYLGQDRMAYLQVVPRGMLAFADGGWMLLMGGLAVVGGLLFPRRVGMLTAWFGVVFLLFVAIGGALRPETPNIRLDVARYWIAFLPPMVMAAVGTVATALTWVWSRIAGERGSGVPGPARTTLAALLAVAVVAGPVRASVEEVRGSPTYVVTNGGVMAAFRNWLHAHDRRVDRVLTDRQSLRVLSAYDSSFTGRPMAKVDWVNLRGGKPRHGDHVVLFSAYGDTCSFCREHMWVTWLPGHRDALRRWEKVWQTDDRSFVVYRVPGVREARAAAGAGDPSSQPGSG